MQPKAYIAAVVFSVSTVRTESFFISSPPLREIGVEDSTTLIGE
jgi:hypothetical protein